MVKDETKVDGKGSSTETVREEEMPPDETALAVKQAAPATGGMLAPAIYNAQEVFGFKETFLNIGREGAYDVHGSVTLYGAGALRVGRAAGVYIHTPKDLVGEDGKRHRNPHIVRNAEGVIVKASYRKIVIHMNPAGHIKFKDLIYTRSILVELARRAMKLMRDGNASMNCKRFATRAMVEKWNEVTEESGEPGAPLWLYYELPNNPMGIAINSNEPHESILEFIDRNVEAELNFESSTETKGERRAIWYVIPESFKPITEEGYAPVITKEGDKTYVDSAWFKVMAPTKAGVLLTLLQKLLMAMLGEDDEAMIRAKEAFATTLGASPDEINISEVSDDELDRTTDPDRMEANTQWEHARAVDEMTGEVGIDPVPASIKDVSEFQVYIKTQLPKLTDDEIKFIIDRGTKHVAKSYCGDDEKLIIEKLPEAITKTNASRFASAFRAIIKQREEASAQAKATEKKEVDSDAARKYIVEELTDGNTARANAVISSHGVQESGSIDDIPDDKVIAIYNELTKPPEPETDASGQAKLI